MKSPVWRAPLVLEIFLKLSFCLRMQEPETHSDEEARYLNVNQATHIVGGVTQMTMWRWANAGETKFGLKLRTKREPVLHHRYYRRDEPPGKHHPLKDRLLILEADVLALKEILEAGGRTEPGPWTPAERDILRAKARVVMRQRNLKANDLH